MCTNRYGAQCRDVPLTTLIGVRSHSTQQYAKLHYRWLHRLWPRFSVSRVLLILYTVLHFIYKSFKIFVYTQLYNILDSTVLQSLLLVKNAFSTSNNDHGKGIADHVTRFQPFGCQHF